MSGIHLAEGRSMTSFETEWGGRGGNSEYLNRIVDSNILVRVLNIIKRQDGRASEKLRGFWLDVRSPHLFNFINSKKADGGSKSRLLSSLQGKPHSLIVIHWPS